MSHQMMTYVESKIDFTKIITLPQMRTQFEPHAIQELADAITQAKGILNPPIVVPFSQKGFTEYVGFVCTVYKQKLSKAEMNSFYKKAVGQKFATMVAGERRLRACHLLWNEGCTECQKENDGNKVAGGKCWYKHFGTYSKEITIRTPNTKDPETLITIQLAENIHYRPSAYEEADAIAKFALFLKSRNKKLSYKKIAEKMHRSPEMVQRSLAFYALPASIRNLVRDKIIRYGIATEVARLHAQLNYTEEQLLTEVNIAVVDKKYRKVGTFANHVTGIITEYIQKKNNEVATLEMMFQTISPEKQIAALLNPETIRMARLFIASYSKVLDVWERSENKVFTKERKFSVGGFIADFAKLIPLLEKILPYVEEAVTVSEAQAMRHDIGRVKRVLKSKQKSMTASVG